MRTEVKLYKVTQILCTITAGQIVLASGLAPYPVRCVIIQGTAVLCAIAIRIIHFLPTDKVQITHVKPGVIEYKGPLVLCPDGSYVLPVEYNYLEEVQQMGKEKREQMKHNKAINIATAALNSNIPMPSYGFPKSNLSFESSDAETICDPTEQRELTAEDKLKIKRSNQRKAKKARAKEAAAGTTDSDSDQANKDLGMASFLSELSENYIASGEWKTVISKKCNDSDKEKPGKGKEVACMHGDDDGPRGTVIGTKMNQHWAGHVKKAKKDSEGEEESEGYSKSV